MKESSTIRWTSLLRRIVCFAAILLLVQGQTLQAQFDGGVEDQVVIKVIGKANLGPIDFEQGKSVEISLAPSSEPKKIQNIIRLSLFEETKKFLPADFTATVSVKIEYGANSSSVNIYTHPFTV